MNKIETISSPSSTLEKDAEAEQMRQFLPLVKFSSDMQKNIIQSASSLITEIRGKKEFGIEEFMQQYSLSTDEGVAIMCLAEGLLRVPDNFVAGELAIHKLANKNWEIYINKSNTLKGSVMSMGLYICGKFADISTMKNSITNLAIRISQPVFLLLLKQAIKFLSKEFIFGNDIPAALKATNRYPKYQFSFDLLGESSRTARQAQHYYDQYIDSINYLAKASSNQPQNPWNKPNLSVKLTALYPRIELAKIADIEKHFLPELINLIRKVKENNLTITFDAEEAKRLDIYLHILTQLILHEEFKDFAGIGLVVQAYQLRAPRVIDYIIDLAKKRRKKIPVRLVKGAYWDSEIKYAQEQGLENYPVYTTKEYTDVSYIVCARKMLENDQHIFSQFATHNALTAATIIELAGNKNFEFQKLHGMGRVLHSNLSQKHRVRIYAPVGKMQDLLAYLMRRMLENGANSSFVNLACNSAVPVEQLAYNLHDRAEELLASKREFLLPKNIYPNRENAMGYDLGYKTNYHHIYEKVSSYYNKVYEVASIIDGKEIKGQKNLAEHFCPAKSAEKFSSVSLANENLMKEALESANKEFTSWSNTEVRTRASTVRKIADLYEENKFELYALLIKEGGKTINDAINEVAEAIDFCRYYASQAEILISPIELPGPTGESNVLTMHPRGIFLCISPWNFPLAIFTGQVVAALVAGNSVIAKPADQTPVIASRAVKLMHKAGIPPAALQLLLAAGSEVGKHVVTDSRIKGVVFTGSTNTAKTINMTLAARLDGLIPLIAETGGQNAMIVDSSALLEQVTDDVLTSAFYSAGQRCSALRILYIQEEIYKPLVEMIKEAMELLKIGDNVDFDIDIGPVINKQSLDALNQHIREMKNKNFIVTSHPHAGIQQGGYYFYPHIIEVNSINDIPDERFGPILHIAPYKAKEVDKVIEEINNYGFGLTFGIHSRIEGKIEYIRTKVKAGNIYANRSIVGAKVESQPFGGENKSGTGFKAGGPNYLRRFLTERTTTINLTAVGGNIELLSQEGVVRRL